MKPALITPIGMVGGLISISAAALFAGLTLRDGRWWEAAIHLVVLGGLLPVIYAVNHRIVPVFSRRQWRSRRLWFLLMFAALSSGVVVALGIRISEPWIERTGAALALVAGLIFIQQLGALFRQPVSSPALPLPFEGQKAVDKIAVRFSRWSGVYLLFGLVTGLMTAFTVPDRGRWDLVWAHAMLLGFVVSTAASVTYHVLPRWTPARWKTPRLIPIHFALSTIATLTMLVALATDQTWLLKIGGPLQAAALLLWGINCAPLFIKLPSVTREAMFLAFGFLAIGISLGAAFSIDAHFGAIYRQVHAEFNVFGWAAILIMGVATYLVPRFAGGVMPWPSLARVQFPAMAMAIFVGGALRRMQNDGRGDYQLGIELSHLIMAAVIASFALQVAMTFRVTNPAAPVQVVRLQKKPASTGAPPKQQETAPAAQ